MYFIIYIYIYISWGRTPDPSIPLKHSMLQEMSPPFPQQKILCKISQSTNIFHANSLASHYLQIFVPWKMPFYIVVEDEQLIMMDTVLLPMKLLNKTIIKLTMRYCRRKPPPPIN